jgi:hypothetical protein
LHCTPLQEITSAVKLLNWGFAMNQAVRPVGVLVPPLATAATTRQASPARAGSPAGPASPVHPASRPAASLARAQPAPSSSRAVQFAVTAGAIAVAGLGLGVLARRRRAIGRHRL